jgi:formylglycine-generating enzyme required for sulfatase activity
MPAGRGACVVTLVMAAWLAAADATAAEVRAALKPRTDAAAALSDEEFAGPFASWKNVRTDFGAVGDGAADDTAAFQAALDAMRDIETLDWCVLYVPAGTYRITSTLRTARAEFWDYLGLTVIGEDPATTAIVWDGPAGANMLELDIWYGKVSRLTLDGRGAANVGIYRWGQFATACEVSDVVFTDMATGLQLGDIGYAGQAEHAVTRCTFRRCSSAGVVTVDFNSLDIWLFWCRFEDCARGAWNVMGNFHAYGNVFLRSTQADIESLNLAPFGFINNTSIGSRVFFDFRGGHSWGSPALVQGNRVYDTTASFPELGPLADVAPSLLTGNGGPWVIVDNLVRSAPGYRGPAAVLASADQVLDGNAYTTPGAEHTVAWPPGLRTRGLGHRLLDRADVPDPVLALPPTPPRRPRKVFEVRRGTGDDAAEIQARIDAASREPYGSRPVVHVPKGYYAILRTVVVPPLRDIQIVGDGMSMVGGGDAVNGTYLSWDAAPGGPLLRLDGPSRAVLRDISVHGRGKGWAGGIVITDCDQPGGRVYADQLHAIYHNTYDFADYGVLVDGLEATDVTLLHAAVGGAAKSGVLVKGGAAAAAGGGADAQVALVTGTAAMPFAQLYDVAGGGRLTVEQMWIESHAHAEQRFGASSRGDLTLAGLFFNVTNAESSPSFAVAGMGGRLSLLASNLVSYTHLGAPAPWFDLSGDGSLARVLALGNILWVDAAQSGGAPVDAAFVWRDATSPPAAAAMASCNMNGASPPLPPGGFDWLAAVTDGQEGLEPSAEAVRAGLAQLRSRRLETPTARRRGATDVKLFRVWVTGGPGASAALELRAGSHPQAPPAPGTLQAVALSPHRVELRWNDRAADETGFGIERKAGPAGAWVFAGQAGANRTTLIDGAVLPNTAYTYRAWASGAGGDSAYSNLATVTTSGPPAVPWDLRAAATAPGEIALAWVDASDNESGFAIERRARGEVEFAEVAVAAAGAERWTDTGLPANAVYGYRIRAVNPWGASRWTAEAVARSAITGEAIAADPIVGTLRYVRGGTFVQGSPRDEPCRTNSEAQFTNTLTRNVAVMETEVTRGMWAELAAARPDLPPDPTEPSTGGSPAHPVQQVTWYETVLFANLLSLQAGFERCYWTDATKAVPIDATNYTTGPFWCDFDADGYRLPTEGEWEHFARAGTTGPFFIAEPEYGAEDCAVWPVLGEFPALETVAWLGAHYVSAECSRPVAQKAANPWGLRDVLGNVAEWCWDPYQQLYPEGKLMVDWVGTGSEHRVARGGSCNGRAEEVRCANRNDHNAPDHRWYNKGFRLVRTAP